MELALKIIGVIASVFALYKVVVDVILAKSSKHREDYELAIKFIDALDNKDTHQFVVERGFLALTGKSYSVQEIQFILSFNRPSEIIKLRASSENFVELHMGMPGYVWKGIFANRAIRTIAAFWYMVWYVITAFLALMPIYLKGAESFSSIVLVFFSLSLSVIAIVCLNRHEDYKSAKKLIQRQHEREAANV